VVMVRDGHVTSLDPSAAASSPAHAAKGAN
jgi:hypothetical protein